MPQCLSIFMGVRLAAIAMPLWQRHAALSSRALSSCWMGQKLCNDTPHIDHKSSPQGLRFDGIRASLEQGCQLGYGVAVLGLAPVQRMGKEGTVHAGDGPDS